MCGSGLSVETAMDRRARTSDVAVHRANGTSKTFKHESSIHCDALVSLPKAALTDYVACLAPARLRALDQALRIALALA